MMYLRDFLKLAVISEASRATVKTCAAVIQPKIIFKDFFLCLIVPKQFQRCLKPNTKQGHDEMKVKRFLSEDILLKLIFSLF